MFAGWRRGRRRLATEPIGGGMAMGGTRSAKGKKKKHFQVKYTARRRRRRRQGGERREKSEHDLRPFLRLFYMCVSSLFACSEANAYWRVPMCTCMHGRGGGGRRRERIGKGRIMRNGLPCAYMPRARKEKKSYKRPTRNLCCDEQGHALIKQMKVSSSSSFSRPLALFVQQ